MWVYLIIRRIRIDAIDANVNARLVYLKREHKVFTNEQYDDSTSILRIRFDSNGRLEFDLQILFF